MLTLFSLWHLGDESKAIVGFKNIIPCIDLKKEDKVVFSKAKYCMGHLDEKLSAKEIRGIKKSNVFDLARKALRASSENDEVANHRESLSFSTFWDILHPRKSKKSGKSVDESLPAVAISPRLNDHHSSHPTSPDPTCSPSFAPISSGSASGIALPSKSVRKFSKQSCPVPSAFPSSSSSLTANSTTVATSAQVSPYSAQNCSAGGGNWVAEKSVNPVSPELSAAIQTSANKVMGSFNLRVSQSARNAIIAEGLVAEFGGLHSETGGNIQEALANVIDTAGKDTFGNFNLSVSAAKKNKIISSGLAAMISE